MQQQKLDLQKALAKIIRNHRQDSISKLSYEIELSKSIWSQVEKGEKDIQLSTFWRIAEALNIKPSKLLNEIESELGDNFSFLENSI